MVSFDGSQQLSVDLEPQYDVVHRTSEVDDISLRMRTNYSSAHLLTSSSRHVTSDLLTVAISDGRISVDIRTSADHKVRTTWVARSYRAMHYMLACNSVCLSVTLAVSQLHQNG